MRRVKASVVLATGLLAAMAGRAEKSAPFLLDTMEGVRESAGDETLTYSPLWDGGEGATVTIAQDGVPLAAGLAGAGEYAWSVARNGTYTLTHTTYTNGVAGKVETATFAVTGKDVPFPAGAVTVTGYTGIYDGAAHGVAVQSGIAGFAVNYGTAQNGEFTAVAPALTDAGSMTVWYEISAPGYITETNSATVTVSKRQVTLTSGSASKVYDGTPVLCADMHVGGDGFAAGEGATYSVTGSRTDAGQSGNAFTYTLKAGTKAGNYQIATVNGTLTVTKAANIWTRKPSIAGWTYGQPANAPDMGAAKFGTATVSYGASGATPPASAGSYTATFTVAGTANYAGLSEPVAFAIAKQTVTPPAIASKVYTGGQQLADVPSSAVYDIAQNAGGINVGQYDVKLRLADPANYTWPDTSGSDKILTFAITKATYDMSGARWDYAGPFAYDGQPKTVRVIGLPAGVSASCTGDTASEPGTYTAHATFTYDTANYNAPTPLADLVWRIASSAQEALEDVFTGLPVKVEPDGEGGWKVTLTNDVSSADLPIELPDDLGHVTIDLNGHDLVGADGAAGSATAAGGDGTPAIRMVPSGGTGAATRLSLVTTGGDALVKGGDGGAGTPGGNGAPAVEVADGTRNGVLVDVGAGVTVRGGKGGDSVTGDGGNGGAGIAGDVGTNDGTITGGDGGASDTGNGGNGGSGVDGNVDVNNGTITGGSGGASAHGRGGDGGTGVTGDVGTNNGTIGGGAGGGTTDGTPGGDGISVGGTPGGGTGTFAKVKVPIPVIEPVEWTGNVVTPQVSASPRYTAAPSSGVAPGAYPVILTLTDTVNYEWLPREGATVSGATASTTFLILEPPPQIVIDDGGGTGAANAASYAGVYDGAGHGIDVRVTNPATGWTVRYAATAEGPFTAAKPLFTNAVTGAETWYEVSAGGYVPVTNVAAVTITPRSIETAAFSTMRFEDVGGVRTPVPALVDDLGHAIPPACYEFRWEETASGAMTFSFTGKGNYYGLLERAFAKTRFTVSFNANGGILDAASAEYDIGTYYGVLPVPFRAGYVFDGWYEDPAFAGTPVTRNTEVIAQDLELHAKWLRRSLWYSDAVFHLEGAAAYDGYLLDPDENDAVAGTILVKAAKPDRRGVSKLSVTIQIAGKKKVALKGTTFDGSLHASASGSPLDLALGYSSLRGTFGRYTIDGTRNIFAAKDADSKLRAAQALKQWRGTYVIAWAAGAAGWNGLSVEIGAKGKAKVVGTLADGAKVTAKSQLLAGERECALAVSWTKKKASVACLVWFREDGTVECGNLPGGVPAEVGNLRTGAKLGEGAAFRIDAGAVAARLGADAGLLPDGTAVKMKGTAFDVAKPGKVKFVKGKGIDPAGLGSNPAGLKLKYTIKNGTFKGSFYAYKLAGGKLKKVTVAVSGVVLGGKGYGTASVKSPAASWAVTIE